MLQKQSTKIIQTSLTKAEIDYDLVFLYHPVDAAGYKVGLQNGSKILSEATLVT